MRKELILVTTLALAACRSEKTDRTELLANSADPVYVDSIFPVDIQIQRFKAARNGAAATTLENAPESRDQLIARFMDALQRRDSAELHALVVNAGEFIDLYYPTSIYARPPYQQNPEITWMLLQQNSEKSLHRLLERFGGGQPNLSGYTCRSEPRIEAANRFWEECAVQWRPTAGGPAPTSIFGSIMERQGRFKFVAYAGDL